MDDMSLGLRITKGTLSEGLSQRKSIQLTYSGRQDLLVNETIQNILSQEQRTIDPGHNPFIPSKGRNQYLNIQ